MNGFTGKHGESEESVLRKRGKNEDDSLRQEEIILRIRNTLDKEKGLFVRQVERQINELTHQVINEIRDTNPLNGKNLHFFDDKTKKEALVKQKSSFQDKVFQPRESLLSELFQVKHISTIYHIFIAFLINLFLNSALHDIIKFGRPKLGFHLIVWNFQSFPLAASIWLGMMSTTLLLYYVYSIWVFRRIHFVPNSLGVKTWDTTFVVLAIAYQIVFLIVPAALIIQNDMGIGLPFALLIEQVRLIMKTYSFIRLNVPKVLRYKNHQKNPNPPSAVIPSFGTYLYFLFVPTLIYRDEYPRTPRIRWGKVIGHFVEVFAVIFYIAFVMDKYLIPSAKNFGKESVTLEELIAVLFGNGLPSLLIFLFGFYCLLHSWSNAFAEMLRFADRMFYLDWWNSSSFAEYYKTWNIIVHDWLYAFIYKDATEKLTKKKSTSTWLVFLTSALFHEFILAVTFKFCYPVLFIAFGILTTLLFFVPTKGPPASGNLFLWLGFSFGPGLCATLYLFEYYARINCPSVAESSIQDFFIPRSWTCNIF